MSIKRMSMTKLSLSLALLLVSIASMAQVVDRSARTTTTIKRESTTPVVEDLQIHKSPFPIGVSDASYPGSASYPGPGIIKSGTPISLTTDAAPTKRGRPISATALPKLIPSASYYIPDNDIPRITTFHTLIEKDTLTVSKNFEGRTLFKDSSASGADVFDLTLTLNKMFSRHGVRIEVMYSKDNVSWDSFTEVDSTKFRHADAYHMTHNCPSSAKPCSINIKLPYLTGDDDSASILTYMTVKIWIADADYRQINFNLIQNNKVLSDD